MSQDWNWMEIQDIYSALYDGPHATPKPSETGPIFLGIKNLTDDGHLDLSEVRHIDEEEFPRWTKRVLPRAGDIVFTYEATLNRYAIIPQGFRGCLGRRLALIRPDSSKIDTRFLFYYFFGKEWRQIVASKINIGSTVDRIPLIDFPGFKIRIPNLPTQRKIAAILCAYDNLIENNLRRIKILEEMAQSLYREWFVKFRFPGHEKVRMVDSPLGMIPAGWRVNTLGEVLELKYGKALKQEERRPGLVPVFGSSGIIGHNNTSLVKGPGIIVGRKGNVGSIFWSNADFYPIDTVYFVTSAMPLRFFFYALKTMNFINNDAAVPGLSRRQAYALNMVMPPDGLLGSFCGLADCFEEQASNLRLRCENLRKTRDLLLPRLISGELDVSELDIKVPEEAA